MEQLVNMLAKACHYAQEHIDDPDAWSVHPADRTDSLQCVSYQIACFLANNTVLGGEGVDWDIVINELSEHPMKGEEEWVKILNTLAATLGGWSPDIVKLAKSIAERAHAGQFRRDGTTPYIKHPEDVAKRLAGHAPEVIATAWLHDTLEDAPEMDSEVWYEAGIPNSVVRAVVALTRKQGENYEDYLERLSHNKIAKVVKVADMLSNLADSPTPKQVEKYQKAFVYLIGAPHKNE